MASGNGHLPSVHLHDGSIGEQAAAAAQAAAHRARDSVSRVVRAREAPEFALGGHRPDVRGWQVHAKNGDRVGVLSSLFIDMRTRAVRYVGVSLDASRPRGAEVLVPVGWVSRPDDRPIGVIHTLSRAQLLAAPRISKRPVTRADEYAALGVYGALPSAHVDAQDLYQGPMFDEWRLFGGPESRAALG
jgi:hypothetical protein